MIPFPFQTGQFGYANAASGDAIFALDAGLTTSYSGSGQTWANAITAPGDGAGQTAYDFYRGTTSGAEGTDPTFNGTAGVDPCYFSFDGGDQFTSVLAAGSVSSFLRQMHFTGRKWTIEAWVYYNGTATNICPIFDTGTSDQGGADTSRGVIFGDFGTSIQTSGRFRLRVKQDSGGTSSLAVQSDAALTATNIYMLAASIDGSGAQASFLYRNGAYDQVGSSDTFTGTFTSPGSTAAANSPKIGARGDSAFRVASGTRIYALRGYQRNLTKAELDVIWNANKARYGL